MSIYEDVTALEELLTAETDPETGEVKEYDAFCELEREVLTNGFERLCKVLKNFEGDAEGLKQEKLRLSQRQKSAERKIERLKEYMKAILELSGKDKVQSGLFTVSLRQSQAINITDEDLLPECCFVIKKEPSKNLIKELLTKGEEVKGAEIVVNLNLQVI